MPMMGMNCVPKAHGAAAGRSAGFFGSRYGTRNRAREAQGVREASQGELLSALLNLLFGFA